MLEICSIDNCTGCRVCEQICPKSAIQMKEDIKGHIYPNIDQLLCIDCKRCVKHCPSINSLETNIPKRVIAGWVKDPNIRKSSTSGGISYAISKIIVANGGLFCGVKWDNIRNETKHELTDDVTHLAEFQGSRYSHSNTSDVYIQIRNLLFQGRVILFSGTPCQVAGLKSFLGKHYNNLYTMDLICHGVPSRKILRDRISTIEQSVGKKVINLKSREKTPNQYFTSVTYFHNDGTSTQISVYEEPFFRGFVENYFLRPNCYKCKFAQKGRVSDITIGDFWGFEPHSLKFGSYRKGTSVILINTSKGSKLFEMLKENLIWEERDFYEAASCNRNLTRPQLIPKHYDEFWERYLLGESLSDLSLDFFPPIAYKISFKSRIKTFFKMVIPRNIFNLLKK